MFNGDLGDARSHLKQKPVHIRIRAVVCTNQLGYFPAYDLVWRKIYVLRLVDHSFGDVAVEPASKILRELLTLNAEVRVDNIETLFNLAVQRQAVARMMLKVTGYNRNVPSARQPQPCHDGVVLAKVAAQVYAHNIRIAAAYRFYDRPRIVW